MAQSEGNVLLVDDSKAMQMTVSSAISSLCQLTCASNIEEAQAQLNRQDFSLVLLDVSLPDGNGFEFCKQLRNNPKFKELPIIFLTGETEIEQRVLGFELGADDYVTKPIEPQEFIARVISKLRKSKAGQTNFRKGDFKIDLNIQKAFLIGNDSSETPLALTPIEFKLLVHFLQNEGKIFSREILLQTVWGDTVHVLGHTVDTHISSLRKKIGTFGSCLKAVMKRGYCFSLSNHEPNRNN